MQVALLGWYDRVARDLPWRRTKDPYAVWLSEVMLQQTRVETVVPYFDRFMATFPTVMALAEAPSDQVMGLWSGLGYYRRARLLHEAARQLATEQGGRFPETAAALEEVRGIGRYTAGAIASIAFGERAPLVDGNVARVLARLFDVRDDLRGAVGMRRAWALADALVPAARAGDWNQALMELGATTCVPRTPRCLVCPVHAWCEARAAGTEASLPNLRPKAKPVPASQTALVATVTGQVLLARRAPDGLFGGVWEPPVVPGHVTDAEGRRAFASSFGLRLGALGRMGIVTHVLSHRRLATEVLSVRLRRAPVVRLALDTHYDLARFVPLTSLAALGLSTLARKVLAQGGVSGSLLEC